jgi:hypothetical protein
MSINFPNSPSLNSVYSYNGRTWVWDGSVWTLVNVFPQLENITVSGSTETYWNKSTLGIHTFGNVGIGTTDPSTKLQVQGDASISGVLTVSNGLTVNNGFVSGAPVTLTGQPFFRNQPFISTDYSIGTSFNEMSIGPITVNSGVTVTVQSGAVWTII